MKGLLTALGIILLGLPSLVWGSCMTDNKVIFVNKDCYQLDGISHIMSGLYIAAAHGSCCSAPGGGGGGCGYTYVQSGRDLDSISTRYSSPLGLTGWDLRSSLMNSGVSLSGVFVASDIVCGNDTPLLQFSGNVKPGHYMVSFPSFVKWPGQAIITTMTGTVTPPTRKLGIQPPTEQDPLVDQPLSMRLRTYLQFFSLIVTFVSLCAAILIYRKNN